LIDQPWRKDALCAGTWRDIDFFFVGFTGKYARDRTDAYQQEIKRICSICPVKADCLEYALAEEEPGGIWGGMDEIERKELLRRRRRSA
jgi:WhiB family redox-sensing transcriptional regulator